MKWTFYPDELDALQKLDSPALKATEEDVIMNEHLRHCASANMSTASTTA